MLLIRGNNLHLPVADHSSAERKWAGGGTNAVWLIASLCFNHWCAVMAERLQASWPPLTSWKHYPQKTVKKLTLTITDVHNALSRINTRKRAGPDNIPGRVLRALAEQGVYTDIFNLLLAQAVLPACFKSTTIVPGKTLNGSKASYYFPFFNISISVCSV